MKKLLVAIDFSKNAIHSLEYAHVYAERFGADIYMIWVDNCVGPDLLIERPDGESRHESKKLFEEVSRKFEDKFGKTKLSYKLSKGKVYHEIAKYAKKIEADLIFTGTHGITGFEEYWIGSNAYRIVTHAPCPVITIRQNFEFKNDIHNILIPIDNTAQSGMKAATAAYIAEAFGAEVQILALHTSGLGSLKRLVEKNLKFTVEHLEKKKIHFQVNEIETKNITQDIIDFTEKNNIDLVAIMTEQETTQANVFLGTYARQLVNNCPVPVLSIRLPAKNY